MNMSRVYKYIYRINKQYINRIEREGRGARPGRVQCDFYLHLAADISRKAKRKSKINWNFFVPISIAHLPISFSRRKIVAGGTSYLCTLTTIFDS